MKHVRSIKCHKQRFGQVTTGLRYGLGRREQRLLHKVTSSTAPAAQLRMDLETPFHALGHGSEASSISTSYQDVVATWPDMAKHIPLVYSPQYNVSFFGVEKLHPFDSCKFSKVIRSLCDQGLISTQQLVAPLEAREELLRDVHTAAYLNAVQTSTWKVAQVTELQPLVIMPNMLVQWRVVRPMKYHAAGTVLAAGLALQQGWAINVGGGMHHAYQSTGMGWCMFDDFYLAVRRLREASRGAVKKVLYIDLDAHQGNGVGRDKLAFNDSDVYILDAFNARIFPKDDDAKPAINLPITLDSGAGDDVYLSKLKCALKTAAEQFKPELVFFNAGTDVLQGDPLGRLGVSEAGVIERDELVWEFALDTVKAPIVMVLGGGYAARSAAVVSASIANLITKFKLNPSQAGPAAPAGAQQGAAAATQMSELPGSSLHQQ
mmetsp:Transcript_38196/g.85123  ORF Transcript_38196/g.85123 Transcript_38196/m.85123 type:complete len:433 (-) Transcript_38196:357-1655(-)